VEVPPDLAEMRLDRRSAPVRMPSASIRAAVAGPMPWKRETVSDSTKPAPCSGVMTKRPSGLRMSLASLARNLL
jgi:hypothetical protein